MMVLINNVLYNIQVATNILVIYAQQNMHLLTWKNNLQGKWLFNS